MEDGSYLLEGTMPIDDLVELMDFTPRSCRVRDGGGVWLLALFDRIPQAGDTVEIEHADAREITHVKFSVDDGPPAHRQDLHVGQDGREGGGRVVRSCRFRPASKRAGIACCGAGVFYAEAGGEIAPRG